MTSTARDDHEARTTDEQCQTVATPPGRRPLDVMVLGVLTLTPLAILNSKLSPMSDPDAWWHVLSGRIALAEHEVVGPDPVGRFSANPWVRIDWLSDIVMAGAHAVGGMTAVSWLYAVLAGVLFAAVYASCRDRADPVVAALVAAVAWMGTYASLQFRPQTVSFILIAVTGLAWWRTTHDLRPRWWLVPLSWVWASLHGLWFMGPAIGTLVVAGLLLDGRLGRDRLVRLGGLVVASLAAACATPLGPRVLLSPFTVNGYAEFVTEYRPPDIHEPYVLATVALLAVTAVGWSRRHDTSWAEVAVWLVALVFAVLYTRTVAIAAVLVAPVAARQLQVLLLRRPTMAPPRIEVSLVVASVVLAAAVGAVAAPHRAPEPAAVPTGLDAAIDALPQGTVILNDEALGGWLLLEHPDTHPVIDTRTYLFTKEYIVEYMHARAGVAVEPFVDRTGATAALLPDDDSAVAQLTGAGWRRAATDGTWILLTAP